MIDDPIGSVVERRVLAGACVSVLAGILIAGLWPFFPPANQVSWLEHEDGLRFGEYGTIFSSAPLNLEDVGGDPACTVEMRLQPGLSIDSNTMLDIYTPTNPFQFRMRQSGDDLSIQRSFRDRQNRERTVKLYVDHAFRQDSVVVITVTAGPQGTSIYLNGRLVKASAQFGLTNKEFHGQIIVGAAPVEDDRWSGKLLGLAFYNQQLNASEVMQHYRAWSEEGQPVSTLDRHTGALYLFAERASSVVHSQVSSGPELHIPKHFIVVGQVFLMPPWKEFYSRWSYGKDIIINIAGFVPLGFFFCAYFSLTGRGHRALFRAILIGAATSLTIEVLQAYIPTRQSGMTDLITNTLGASLGATLFQCGAVQILILRLNRLLPEEMQRREHVRGQRPGQRLPDKDVRSMSAD